MSANRKPRPVCNTCGGHPPRCCWTAYERRKPRLTNKEKVLRRHPGAVCFHYQGAWQVENIAYESSPFGRGRTPAQAWADAARRLT